MYEKQNSDQIVVNLASLLGVLVQCLTLLLEDSNICLEKVLPFHAFTTRHRTDKDSNIDTLECRIDIRRRHHLCNKQIVI